jgi:DNA modification methylase
VRRSAIIDTQAVYCGDNLDQLQALPDGCVDLIYIDPPFNSNQNYEAFWGEKKEKRAFEDRHASTQAYINYMRPRCIEIARVLKRAGSFYYHCDWHASHYVKVMLDQIFGESSFQNEIVWRRTNAHGDTHGFGHVHDILFRYSNGEKPTFNVELRPHSPEYIAKYFIFEDEFVATRGLHWRDNITGSGLRRGDTGVSWRGIDPARIGKGRHWAKRPSDLEKMAEEGRVYFPPDGSVPKIKRYEKELRGIPIDSIWDDIPSLGGLSKSSKESIGYPTQKPLALLERVIKASSNEGDIVLDAFCGCGTALVAAQSMSRQWIGIDVSPTACRVMAKRLRDSCGLTESEALWKVGRGFVVRDLPWTEERLRKLPPFEFENWAVVAIGGLPNSTKVGDMGIDGRIFPVTAIPKHRATGDRFGFMEDWFPVQVKQKDKAGRPDIDSFEAVMHREDRQLGFFVSFTFTADAEREARRFSASTGREIRLVNTAELIELDHERMAQKRPVASAHSLAGERVRRAGQRQARK